MLNNSLKHKEYLAIKLLKSIPSDDIELCYSGGKDSDVILYLARLAGIPFTAIYKNTTIDPPGTIKHCQENGVQIVQPRMTFFELIEKKGFPSRFARFCCSELKEYKIKDYAILGIRREESKARAKRYIEPEQCRVYSKTEKCKQYFPILYWTKADIEEYITQNHIQLHPLYYDQNGKLDCKKRLGCMGCPLQSDKGLQDFRNNPKLVRQWLRHGKVWWDTHPNLKVRTYLRDIYELFVFRTFTDRLNGAITLNKEALFPTDWKKALEDYFNINLD